MLTSQATRPTTIVQVVLYGRVAIYTTSWIVRGGKCHGRSSAVRAAALPG